MGWSQRNLTVLYAEDDRFLAETMCEALGELGFSVVHARDGAEAAVIARERPFDVLMTDIDMPGMDGMELVAVLRAEMPALPVVVLSGNPLASGRDASPGMGTGPLVMLAKPAGIAHIKAALDRVAMAGGAAAA
jgi:CheY-like chemotaxis protein